MNFSDCVLKNEERVIFALRRLYEQYGYARYKVSKFEEYDFYAHNKSFLISENVLTFTDTNGKLMALKPDVTLSIVKNARAGETQKLYYNENVYRTAGGSDGFREILQTGLECIGDIDLFATVEVLSLAKQSLALISEDHILDISHMGFLSALLDDSGVTDELRTDLIREIGNKSIGAIRLLCEKASIDTSIVEALCRLTSLYEPFADALQTIKPMIRGNAMQDAYDELCRVWELLDAEGYTDRLYLDFSMINDMRYYNGIIFRGFVNGLPDGILSGGRYDSLMKTMGKLCGAIGFAVYLDQIALIDPCARNFDVDVLLLYDASVSSLDVLQKADQLRTSGENVLVLQNPISGIRARRTICMTKGGVSDLEKND